jgi:hypothetical protein
MLASFSVGRGARLTLALSKGPLKIRLGWS